MNAPLDTFRAALAQAASEPDDKVAIPLSAGPDTQPRGVTWGQLKEVAKLAESAADVRDQASRYLSAVYGPDVVYRAPETFPNLVERWIVYIALGAVEAAGRVLIEIERQAAEVGAGR